MHIIWTSFFKLVLYKVFRNWPQINHDHYSTKIEAQIWNSDSVEINKLKYIEYRTDV